MTDEQKLNRLRFLSHDIFVNDARGKELLGLMKWNHVTNPILPKNPLELDHYGGAFGYTCFREGMIHFVRKIEIDAQEYMLNLENEIKSKENV